MEDKVGAVALEEFRHSIEFRGVGFSYDGQRQVLNDISFEVRRGETVALVGPSGGGKSTLSELIPRFYDPTQGELFIDDKPLQDYTQASVREHMGIVSQDTILFNDTIRNNIAMGRQDATDEQIIAAAKVANAHDFIMQTEAGYDTNIGDRGMKLSGGQRQRLSIARALVGNPEIIILDDSSSALDFATDAALRKSLKELKGEPTVFIVSQRTSSIQHADLILVLEDGDLVGKGTHEELLKSCEVYQEIYMSQYKKEE